MGTNRIRLLCFVLAMLLLCGCKGNSVSNGAQSSESDQQDVWTVGVYSEQRYKAALEQVFSHINLTEKRIQIHWTGEKNGADVIITDQVNPEELDDYAVVEMGNLNIQPVEQLILRDDRGAIGIPVFLRMDSFWYDALLYENTGVSVPHSLDSWKSSNLNQAYPAVCSENDVSALFWGVVAPLYLGFGGESKDLSCGEFDQESLLAALQQLEMLRQENLLKLTSDARQLFTSTQASFWIAGVERVAESYHYMSTLSSWDISLGLPFAAQVQPMCVLRSDMLMIRQTTDPELAKLFLQLFFRQQTIAELSGDLQMTMACHMQYSPSVIPELVQACYTALSSPTVKLVYTSCCWERGQQERVYGAILSLMKGELTAAQAAEKMQS